MRDALAGECPDDFNSAASQVIPWVAIFARS
jgi:hypothetical protein